MATNEENDDNWEVYKSMMNATASLFNNEFLADIQFQFDDKIIYAHSHELSKRSKVFARQYHGTIGDMKLIVITDQQYTIFYEFLKYIYTDTCKITAQNGFALLKLAIFYEIISLKTTIRQFLINNMACDNVLQLYEFCLVENFMSQISRISTFISENYYVLIKSNEFLNIRLETLIELLKFDKIDNVTREIDICTAVMNWANRYCEKKSLPRTGTAKQSILNNALKHIRFPVMSSREFSQFIQNEKTFLTTEEINAIFISKSLQQSNEIGFIAVPRTISIDYSAGPDIILNMRPFFGFDTKLPFYQNKSSFSVSQNVILTSIDIGVGSVTQNIEIDLLNQTTQVMRHIKVEHKQFNHPVSIQAAFDLPFLLRAGSKYCISTKYSKPSNLVNCIMEKKLSKIHYPFNKFKIEFDEISPFLLQMNFKQFN